MLSFKCFNYGGVGHFASKFPHNKNMDNKYQGKFNPNERRKGKNSKEQILPQEKEKPLFQIGLLLIF
jgi:hypothetical protein